MNNKTHKLLLGICICVSIYFISCKKYPENDLWFKNPEKTFKGGKLTDFTVNGVDSMPMWERIYTTPPEFNGFYNPFDVRTIEFSYSREGNVLSSNLGVGTLEFFNNGKEVSISFSMIATAGSKPRYNLFYTKNSNWKILKLYKGGMMRIQRIYNDKTYEIQFN
jgi:hypothetical protein